MKSKINSLFLFSTIAAIVFAITAYNSHGYYHGDEHYQIIEFAGLKLGTHAPEDLAWEFKTKIRPTLQPTIAFLTIKTLVSVGVTDPYHQAFLLRLLTALLALVCISFFIKKTEHIFKETWQKRGYYFISYFLWFIPYLSVRFSSEIWSGLFFLVSIALCQSKKQNNSTAFLIGLAFGLSFLFRFQLGICIAVAFLWLSLVKKLPLKSLLIVGAGFALLLVLSIFIDSWFYNELVFTPWSYFKIQLLEGAAAGFGTSPWHFYLEKIFTYPSLFIGIPLVLSILVVGLKHPKSIFLWSVLSFLIVHSVIAHKEERFMFPIAFLFPIILSSGIVHFYAVVKSLSIPKKMVQVFGIILLVLNFIGLAALATKAAGLGRMAISKYIHENYGNQRVNLISTDWSNPYNPWQSLPTKFYLEKDLVSRQISNLCAYNDSLIAPKKINLLVMRKIDFDDPNCKKGVNFEEFELIKQSVPPWIQKINKVYKGLDERNVFLLFKRIRED